jgi:hypothetical protein
MLIWVRFPPDGFATESQVNVGVDQPIEPLSSNQSGKVPLP